MLISTPSGLEDGLAAEGTLAVAGASLSKCLDIRQEALPQGHWLIFNTVSDLGERLAGQGSDPSLALEARIKKLHAAEPLLLDGYEGLIAAESIPEEIRDQRIRQPLERIVKLYETWHTAEPDDEGEHRRESL